MDDSGPTASIICFLLLVLIDMFFFGFGTASNNVNRKEVERRAEEEKDKKAIRLWKIVSAPGEFVNTMLLIVTMINVIVGALYFFLWWSGINKGLNGLFLEQLQLTDIPLPLLSGISAMLAMLLLLYILLTFGVLLPKKLAAKIPDKWSYMCINLITLVMFLVKPVTALVTLTTNAILFLFGFRDKDEENDITEEELISMVQEGHEQGVLLESEALMISNIFELDDKEVQDIMTHRKYVVAIDGSTCLSEAISFMLAEKYSRYPVYEENLDHVMGILHLKDACRYEAAHGKGDIPICQLPSLLREACFVPQTKNVDELFKEMQSNKTQMVIVIDEYGQMDGLLAMEDILEEIVGNIQDEYDEDKEYIEDKGNDEYIIEGKTPLEDLEERFGISFENEEFETLNGFLISRLDKIPEPDEQFDVDYQGFNFKILSVEKKMIGTVLVTKKPEEEKSIEAADLSE